MKSRVALIAAALLASSVALACPLEGPPGHRGPGPDLDRMAVLLDLNDSQKAEVQRILSEERQKLKAAHDQVHAAGTTPSREEKQKFHAELKQDTTTKLQAVLSPEQMKKFDALTERPRGRFKHDAAQ